MAVNIISGENEALYAYISINSDRFNTSQPFMEVMDMGGATTQLTFQPDADILANISFCCMVMI